MAAYLHSMSTSFAGYLVLVATQDEASASIGADAIPALRSVLGMQASRVGWKQMLAMVSTVGATESLAEQRGDSGEIVDTWWWKMPCLGSPPPTPPQGPLPFGPPPPVKSECGLKLETEQHRAYFYTRKFGGEMVEILATPHDVLGDG